MSRKRVSSKRRRTQSTTRITARKVTLPPPSFFLVSFYQRKQKKKRERRRREGRDEQEEECEKRCFHLVHFVISSSLVELIQQTLCRFRDEHITTEQTNKRITGSSLVSERLGIKAERSLKKWMKTVVGSEITENADGAKQNKTKQNKKAEGEERK